MTHVIKKYKDLQAGDCWMFAGGDMPTVMVSETRPGAPRDLPGHWEWDSPDPTYLEWANRDVELLAHYSTHPNATPINKASPQRYAVVPTSAVKPGQWCIGIWTRDSAREALQDVNKSPEEVKHYRAHIGPLQDDGYVVVHAQDHDERQHVLKARVGGLTGEECLRRYEMAMRTESLCRVGNGFVCTHADYALDQHQVAHAQAVWRAMMARKRDEEVERDRMQVVCDEVDEMPNMGEG